MSEERGLLQASVRLGRVAGIPIGLHYSWFIIAALITFSLTAHFRETQPSWLTPVIWGAAVLTAVLFFVTLLAHELSHSVVARAHGIPVKSITLFALGGIAQTGRDANAARTEFLIAIAGPAASIVIGLACVAAAAWMGWSVEGSSPGLAAAILGWLGSINVLIALFNLIPGYPLDGGRVLRSILWGFYDDRARATRTAARVGQAVAGGFIAIGLFQFFSGAGLGGLWLTFIGWFLLMAAQASYAQVTIDEILRDVTVADVMAGDFATVDARTDLQHLVDEVLIRTGRRTVMVEQDGRPVGLVTPREVREVERERWPSVAVAEVMRPLEQVKTVAPDVPVREALSAMAQEDVNQLPVMVRGRLEGMITRGQILRLLKARSELKA